MVRTAVITAFFTLCVAATAWSGEVTITPFVGGYTFAGSENLTTRPEYGVRAGYFIWGDLAAEAVVDYTATRTENGNRHVGVWKYRGEAVYHLRFVPTENLVPHLAVGGGATTFSGARRETAGLVDYGGGFSYHMAPQVALRGDVRHVFLPKDTRSNIEYTLGLSYIFGGKGRPAVAKTSFSGDTGRDRGTDTRTLQGAPSTGQPITQTTEPGDREAGRIKAGGPGEIPGGGGQDMQQARLTEPRKKSGATAPPDGPEKRDIEKDGSTTGDARGDGTPQAGGSSGESGITGGQGPTGSSGDGAPQDGKFPDSTQARRPTEIPPSDRTEGGATPPEDNCARDADKDGFPDICDRCPGTPIGTPVDRDGCPEKKKVCVTLGISFDFDKFAIKPEFEPELARVANFLRTYPTTTAIIEGHTDSVGATEYNHWLSFRRADSVMRRLVDKYNINPGRLAARGYGESKPQADNTTAQGRQKNRRIEAVIDCGLEPIDTGLTK